MKETYAVKCPMQIVFGDPLYFKQFKGEKLNSLTVNFIPPPRFAARVVLEESTVEDMPDYLEHTISIYTAPERTMQTYLDDMMYESQEHKVKDLGVDSARYYLRVDGRDETIHTGGDGYWGTYQEMTRTVNGEPYLDAAILTIFMPEFETMASMRERLNYLFRDVQLLDIRQDQSETNSMISPT